MVVLINAPSQVRHGFIIPHINLAAFVGVLAIELQRLQVPRGERVELSDTLLSGLRVILARWAHLFIAL